MRLIRSSLLRHSAVLTLGAALAAFAAPAVHAQDSAAPDAADDAGKDIVVTGTRLSLRAATAEKKNADNFVEALQANDVGKLPDQNVAEAVKRLPGIAVYNDQGRRPLSHHPRCRSRPGQRHAQWPDAAGARAEQPPGEAG